MGACIFVPNLYTYDVQRQIAGNGGNKTGIQGS